ncbi:carbohydrate-binding domain-containing protein [Clostridium sp. BNL1100]|uniref:carbohydrate-binding domain-containing protein n=1 Tax=Clostridium sp. BNL1100 TaxID=755731 RepID=UPI00024A789E|nr:carbohydrate-binding domain-containing protein [Clostridium sp. BNL1100]AEY64362.1 dockerin-like protein [Clostridium sp. BNL1100]
MKKKLVLVLTLAGTLACSSMLTKAAVTGDLNSDGGVNALDIAAMKSSLLGVSTISDTKAADLNGDSSVDAIDFALLKSYLLGNITTFPVDTVTPVDPEDAWKANVGKINLGSTITCTGTGVAVSGSTVNITAGGDFEVAGTLSNGMIYVNTTEKVKLRLNGCNITNSSGPAIYFQNVDKGFITIVEGSTNNLTDAKTYSTANSEAKAVISSNDDLEIKGAGTLNITGNYKHGIAGDDDIKIENGNINIKSAPTDGIHCNNTIEITGGTLNITATSDCIDTDGDIIIENGTLALSAGDDGIHSELDLTFNGGTTTVLKSYEGIEGKTVTTVNNGTINITATEDGLCAGNQLVINGGNIAIMSGKDPYDSNGTITMTGGNAVIYGGGQPDGCADCDTNNFTITGGTLAAVGGCTSSPTASTSKQCSAILTGPSLNAVVSIKNASGTEIYNFTAKKAGSTLLFTSPSLLSGQTYNLYINGTLSKTFTTSTMVTTAGGSIFGGGGIRW